MKRSILILLLSLSFLAFAHEGHEEGQEGRPATWTEWIGGFHLIFLHFPIALVNMLALSELLFIWLKSPLYEASSRFLVVSAAIISLPTAVLGLIYSYSASYVGLMASFLWWHMWLGISAAVLAIAAAFIREGKGVGKLYYISLFMLFLVLNIGTSLGGGMTFGPYHMLPPI